MLPVPLGVQISNDNQQPPHLQDLLPFPLYIFIHILGGGTVLLGRVAQYPTSLELLLIQIPSSPLK